MFSKKPEPLDAFNVRYLGETLSNIVANEEDVSPKTYDYSRMLAKIVYEGDERELRMGALMELVVLSRRLGAMQNQMRAVLEEWSKIIGNKVADFPQAKEIGEECQKVHNEILSGMASRLRGIRDTVYADDLPEILGDKDYIRSEVIRLGSPQ